MIRWPSGMVNSRTGVGGVHIPLAAGLPAYPVAPRVPSHPGGAPATGPTPSPLAGMHAYGVPVDVGPDGRGYIRAGGAGGNPAGFQMPPNVPGMPQMPGSPVGLFGGPGAGAGSGGLLQSVTPVKPFNPSNLVQQMKVRDAVNLQ